MSGLTALYVAVLGICMCAVLAGISGGTCRRDSRIYGNAKFARGRDLQRAGLVPLTGTSILVGRTAQGYLGVAGQRFALVAAPTRSGKGVGVVVPNLLHFADSVVVLDIKGENFELTSGWRERQGQQVYVFNPFAEDGCTHRWNPLFYVSDVPSLWASDLSSIAAMLYPDGDSQNRFWVSQARSAFTALALYAFERWHVLREFDATDQWRPTLGLIYRLSVGGDVGMRRAFQNLRDESFVSAQTRVAFDGVLSQAEDTFLSILASVREPLNTWLNPTVDRATGGNDFDLNELRRRRLSIYVVIPPHRLAECRLIVNLFFTQVLNCNTRVLPSQDRSLRYQCLLLMDEFTSIGKVEPIASAIAYMAGYNLRLLPIIQSVAQLESVYGKEMARTLMTNHSAQILFAPREQSDAKEYSEMLGDRSAIKQSRNRGRESSISLSEERRPLMLPQELKAMGQDKCVLTIEGVKCPVLAQKIVYYRDPVFKKRLFPSVHIMSVY